MAGSRVAVGDCFEYRADWSPLAGNTHWASVFYTAGDWFVVPHSQFVLADVGKTAPFVSDGRPLRQPVVPPVSAAVHAACPVGHEAPVAGYAAY